MPDPVEFEDARHLPEEALSVDTYVVASKGQWQVDIVVIFANEIVRRTVGTYRSERLASVAASWIKRAAARDIKGPLNG
jgi:hypothetical protein